MRGELTDRNPATGYRPDPEQVERCMQHMLVAVQQLAAAFRELSNSGAVAIVRTMEAVEELKRFDLNKRKHHAKRRKSRKKRRRLAAVLRPADKGVGDHPARERNTDGRHGRL